MTSVLKPGFSRWDGSRPTRHLDGVGGVEFWRKIILGGRESDAGTSRHPMGVYHSPRFLPPTSLSLSMSTTPTKTAHDKVGDTSIHARMSSIHSSTSTAEEYDPVFVVAANEIAGKYLGPISTETFLNYYLPESK